MTSTRVRRIRFQEKEMILLDFSGITPGPEFFDLVKQAGTLIHSCTPDSALTLIDVTDSEFDLDMLEALMALAVGDKSYVKASAIVGATGLHEKAREAIARASHRLFRKFNLRKEAMEWLVKC